MQTNTIVRQQYYTLLNIILAAYSRHWLHHSALGNGNIQVIPSDDALRLADMGNRYTWSLHCPCSELGTAGLEVGLRAMGPEYDKTGPEIEVAIRGGWGCKQ